MWISGQSPSHEHGEKKWHDSMLYVIRAEKEKETAFREIPTKKKGNSWMRGIKLLHTIKQIHMNPIKLNYQKIIKIYNEVERKIVPLRKQIEV